MQDIFGSVRRSLVFKSTSGGGGEDGGFTGFVEKIGSSIRKSRVGLFAKPSIPSLPPPSKKEDAPLIRWRKGELIGCGAFGRVYMGMNLDSGELLAIKQVSIAASSASKEKTQAHIRELEEEVKLLKNLSHPNIVRYLGTAREDDSLNILLEFVPGGSISSLLGKFGSFPESVIRMYTKQLLLGLEYLHKNGIMHRDIKGANILVDNKGCIKLADFGASKKVVELATINGAKSMKGTPYWMAPEVILQTGHSFSADIWSVGCTVIEMATGKPPWSQQYQEVAALFHIGTTKSHPPIPEHLSIEAKDFLLKCLQEVPNLRPAASELLQHPFVTGKYQETHSVFRNSVRESGNLIATSRSNLKSSMNSMIRRSTCDVCEMGSVKSSTVYHDNLSRSRSYWGAADFDDDMCLIDDTDDFASVNPMCEPLDDWPCKFDEDPLFKRSGYNLSCSQSNHEAIDIHEASGKGQNDFTFPCGPVVPEDEDEVTESKIIAFLDEKALDLKKLQTPLYEEFYNSTLNTMGAPTAVGTENSENPTHLPSLPPKSRSPKRLPSRRLSAVVDAPSIASPGRQTNHVANESSIHNRALQEIQPPQLSEWKEFLHDGQQETLTSSTSETRRKWEEELFRELEMMRQAGRRGREDIISE
ncbi:mitogen-activated protein kinase kinase kinase NPK1-like isoform X4 [Populus alba x Populus x berolinensis]|nr:mitogen-activated protein kinase kinase kinase NPK1-like isoform X4 [Populus alba x Populus x berolinensis]